MNNITEAQYAAIGRVAVESGSFAEYPAGGMSLGPAGC